MSLLMRMKKALGGKSKKGPVGAPVDALTDPLQDELTPEPTPWALGDVGGLRYAAKAPARFDPNPAPEMPALNGTTAWASDGVRQAAGGASETGPTIGHGGTRLAEALIKKAPQSNQEGARRAMDARAARGMGGEALAESMVKGDRHMFEEGDPSPGGLLGRLGI